MTAFLTLLIRAYQRVLSPALHGLCGPLAGCRFQPTCSHYCIEALEKHGALRGSLLGVRRLCRCNPWGASGPDPVPPARPAVSTRHSTTRLYGQKR